MSYNIIGGKRFHEHDEKEEGELSDSPFTVPSLTFAQTSHSSALSNYATTSSSGEGNGYSCIFADSNHVSAR